MNIFSKNVKRNIPFEETITWGAGKYPVCPKCTDWCFPRYHNNCSDFSVEHMHVKCDNCKYQFATHTRNKGRPYEY